jgi:hypothetical protein
MRSVITLAAIVAVTTALAGSASAATCGDANDDDSITVTDGVQALRAAASLTNTCGEGCDVDGSGGVSVTDGVNILRAVAGLSFTSSCDFTGEEANEVVNPSLAIFGGLSKLPGFGSGVIAAGTSDCENDGTIESVQTNAQSLATFTNCQIDNVIFDGGLARVTFGQGVVLGFQELRLTRIKSGKSLTYTGQLGITESPAGKRLAGTLMVESSERGSFTVQFQRILIVKDGSVRGGQLIYDLTDATGGKIAMIQMTFDVGEPIAVRVELRTGQVKSFVLDRVTRRLRPPF